MTISRRYIPKKKEEKSNKKYIIIIKIKLNGILVEKNKIIKKIPWMKKKGIYFSCFVFFFKGLGIVL